MGAHRLRTHQFTVAVSVLKPLFLILLVGCQHAVFLLLRAEPPARVVKRGDLFQLRFISLIQRSLRGIVYIRQALIIVFAILFDALGNAFLRGISVMAKQKEQGNQGVSFHNLYFCQQ